MAHGTLLFPGIALRAFLLGILCATSATIAALLVSGDCRLWRLPAYVSIMSTFHFLEFYVTARWNNPRAEIASFLLSTHDYKIAHSCGILEIAITSQIFPGWHARLVTVHTIVGGAILTVLGQVVRTSAMVQSGYSFNHQVENEKREDHKLINTGLYSWSRHPSYIGLYFLFVGIQIMVGNKFSTLFLACFLWVCLKKRIQCKSVNTSIASPAAKLFL
jgi:protein-S-isoprenylcysteine O-methyltransferase